MSVEFISSEPTNFEPVNGPSTGSWSTHTTTGDAEGSFPNMDADADLERISCLESMCMNCHETGMTRMLLTKIPYFREIVVMSFACPHCHMRNSEVQPAADLSEQACRQTLKVLGSSNPEATRVDLNRQVIKSETGSILIPELEFEIPPNKKRGDINTVEGILTNIADSLEVDQPNREIQDPENASKIQVIIEKFRSYASGEESFTFVVEDLAGNSFLENPFAPSKDERATITYFPRTREQTIELGYSVEENQSELASMPRLSGEAAQKKLEELFPGGVGAPATSAAAAAASKRASKEQKGVQIAPASMASIDTYFNVSDRSAVMLGQCNTCDNPEAETRLCVTDIPHFKDVALLVTQCEQCGFRDAEVKPMGIVSEKGRKITLKVATLDDLKRDLLKSDTSSILIPELDLELVAGTLGGKYTTLEGLLEDIREQLTKFNPFAMGDSSQAEQKSKMTEFLERLSRLSQVEEPWTFVLDDPLGNCFIFSTLGESDPQLTSEQYERTFEQNEELGLNDMNVDHYLTEEQQATMDAAIKAEEAQAAIEKEMVEAMGQASVSSSSSTSEEDAKRMVELKQSKIGGLISVEHHVDQAGATGNKQ